MYIDNAHCTMYIDNVHCTMYIDNAHCTMYIDNAHCTTVYNVTLYTVVQYIGHCWPLYLIQKYLAVTITTRIEYKRSVLKYLHI